MPDVGDLLSPILELLGLLSQRLRVRLSPDELRRARGLLALLGSPGVDPRRYARTEVTGRVYLVPVAGPIVVASVRDLGAGGARIAARRLPAAGTHAVAHFLDPQRGVRDFFPVIVAWIQTGPEAQAGLCFAGPPRRRCSSIQPVAPAPSTTSPTVPLRRFTRYWEATAAP